MKRERDHQQSKLYAAEWSVFDRHAPPEFKTVSECKDYQKQIIESEYWQQHKGWKRVGCLDGRACRDAYYWPDKRAISLPKWARSRWLIIHEMAHCLTHRTHTDASAHGKFFCMHYLALVRELLGDEAGDKLQAEFESLGVRY